MWISPKGGWVCRECAYQIYALLTFLASLACPGSTIRSNKSRSADANMHIVRCHACDPNVHGAGQKLGRSRVMHIMPDRTRRAYEESLVQSRTSIVETDNFLVLRQRLCQVWKSYAITNYERWLGRMSRASILNSNLISPTAGGRAALTRNTCTQQSKPW